MKKIISIGILCLFLSTSLTAQDIDDVLYKSQKTLTGTPRYTAMGGAFLALGGDLSATSDNPAGGSIFKYSTVGGTINYTNDSYYVNGNNSSYDDLDLGQFGGVFVFNSTNQNNPWGKYALSFNYSNISNRQTGHVTSYDFPFPTATSVVNDEVTTYELADQEQFISEDLKKFSVGFSGEYKDILNLGIGLNLYNSEYDIERLDYEFINESEESFLYGNPEFNYSDISTGVSITAGAIVKIEQFRIAASIESPQWHQVDRLDYEIDDSGFTDLNYNYNITIPLKMNIGAAVVLGEYGILSADYGTQNLSNARIKSGNETILNNMMEEYLTTQNTLKLGAEFRLKPVSLRAGYQRVSSPFSKAYDGEFNYVNRAFQDEYEVISGGIGIQFGKTSVDASIRFYERNEEDNVFLSDNGFAFNTNQLENTHVSLGITHHF